MKYLFNPLILKKNLCAFASLQAIKNKLKYSTLLLILIPVSLGLVSCDKLIQMITEKEKIYGWSCSVTAPRNYPVEVHRGYLATEDRFITAIYNSGSEEGSWNANGTDAGGGSGIPSMLSLTWLSFAEKKFWSIDTILPTAKLQALFEKGYYDIGVGTVKEYETYKNITIAVAPGGVVALFLGDPTSTQHILVDTFQAKTAFVDINDFVPVKSIEKEDPKEFHNWNFENLIPVETQNLINTQGIPYHLWKRCFKKYHWKYVVAFYKPDSLTAVRNDYYNGENNYIGFDEMSTYDFEARPLPKGSELYFDYYWDRVGFDEEELYAGFEELTKNNPEEPIEIIVTIAHEYMGATFALRGDKRRIPLKNVKSRIWRQNGRNRSRPGAGALPK